MTPMDRRSFLAAGLTGAVLGADAAVPNLEPIDLRALIGRADLHYDKPVARSEEGMPIGNGQMGTLVWTTPTQLRFQINRVDVYANNSATVSFVERHNDYCGGGGFLDLEFEAGGGDPFPDSGFAQHLSVYDGSLQIGGQGVTARIAAWPKGDVIAIDVQSARACSAVLRMLRFDTKYFGQQLETFAREHAAAVETREHIAISRLETRDGRILLTQEFRERDYRCNSAVAVCVTGRTGTPRLANETEVRLDAHDGGQRFTLLIASAAAFGGTGDVAAAALRQLDDALLLGPALFTEAAAWWRDFWARGYVSLSSPDGEADLVERHYHYFLYLMASTSRGHLPPKFNGMLWNTGGDLRTWGAQHWFANLSCYYEMLPASNRMDLMEPAFDMYWGMRGAGETAARQQWGSQGFYIAETSYFDGLEKLPDDIAAEMRELYLLKKPWAQRSARFMEFAAAKHPHSSRWNWIEKNGWENGRWTISERGSGPFGNVNHILGTTAKIAYLFWRRYEFTLDLEWLRNRAYPMLAGAVEFYRNFPNLSKEPDGQYHIHGVNSNEGVWGARDTDEDLSAMRGVTAAALRASVILNVDADRRPVWREFLDHLAPLPDSDTPDAIRPAAYTGPRVFVRGLKPAVKAGNGLLPDANSLPMWFFDLCNVESKDRALLELANATFNAYFRGGMGPATPVSVLSKLAIAAASLGRADAVRYLIPNQIRALAPERATAYKNGGVLANHMTLREGPQALDAQRLGRASEALHLALLQSNPPAPGDDPVLHVFPAWPNEWNARFRLAARGAFIVSSSFRQGRIEYVGIESTKGGECRLRNPCARGALLYRNGRKAEAIDGPMLRFPAAPGENIIVIENA